MNQKVFKSVWLRVAIIVAVFTTTFAGTAWAQDDVLYKTALFGTDYNSKKCDKYDETWTATNNGFTVTVSGFSNADKGGPGQQTQQWDYIQAAGKKQGPGNNADYATITTEAIDKAITRVQLTIDAVAGNTPFSIKLQSTADYDTWTDEGTFSAATGTQTVAIANPAENRYYRIEFLRPQDPQGPQGVSNTINVSKVEYFVAAPDPEAPATPVISATEEPTFGTSTDVTITVDDDDATIMYSKTNGTSWDTYTGAITLTETTTIKAKAVKGTKESPIVSKSFILASDVSTATWNLATTSTGVQTTSLLTWTNEDAAVLSFVKGSGENLPTGPKQEQNVSFHSFKNNNMVRVAPTEGYAIVSVVFTLVIPGNGNGPGAANAANALQGTWSNATASAIDGNKITVTAIDGTKAISTTFTGECKIKEVDLNWSFTTSPYIAAPDVTVPSVGETGTITVDYNRINETPALYVCDAEGNGATYDWFTAELDADNNISYTVAANTGAERTAYLSISAGNVQSEIIAVTQEAGEDVVTVSVTSAGWATYCGEIALDFEGTGITAYVATLNGTSLSLTPITQVPANVGVILKSESGAAIDASVPELYEAPAITVNNCLTGVNVQTTLDPDDLILNVKNGKPGFYRAATNTTLRAHRAYISREYFTGGVKDFIFDEDDATAIQTIESAVEDGAIYNVAGQRLQKMQKGINIVNGKKILF